MTFATFVAILPDRPAKASKIANFGHTIAIPTKSHIVLFIRYTTILDRKTLGFLKELRAQDGGTFGWQRLRNQVAIFSQMGPIHRWRAYEKHLASILRGLEPYCGKFGYD